MEVDFFKSKVRVVIHFALVLHNSGDMYDA